MANEVIYAFCVFDVKSGLYDVPFFALNEVLAKRRFILDCQARENENVLSAFKDDYELHKVGAFHNTTGVFDDGGAYKGGPVVVITGKEVDAHMSERGLPNA